MGYRWHKGRLLSDEEYYSETSVEAEDVLQTIAYGISILLIGWLGYLIANGKGAMIGGIIGGVIGYIFKSFFEWLAEWLVKIILFIIVIAVIALVIWFLIFVFISLPS